jgi:hypothetical protein
MAKLNQIIASETWYEDIVVGYWKTVKAGSSPAPVTCDGVAQR